MPPLPAPSPTQGGPLDPGVTGGSFSPEELLAVLSTMPIDMTFVDADDRVRRYAVTDVEKVAKAEVPLDQVFRRDGDPALVVITCGGSFDRGRGYSDNVVVTARPLR